MHIAILALSILLGLALANSDGPCAFYHLQRSYDVIVVGTGVGGAVVARRLAERNPSWQILSIERGPAYGLCPLCSSASGDALTEFALMNDPLTGRMITSTPNPGLAGFNVTFKDTDIQGGSTAINGMQHVRGDAPYYFDTFFPPSWKWDTMIPFFEKYEAYHFPPGFYGPHPFPYRWNFRGANGPVDVRQSTAVSRYFDATIAVYPNIASHTYRNGSLNNGYFPGLGSAAQEFTNYEGVRSSSYVSYLQDYPGSNLIRITDTRVNKIIFTGKKATGVEIVFYNVTSGLANSTTCNVHARNIVVSAGTIGTPKLLKLSGVGPASELRAMGIPVVSNLPDVGANLDDHVTTYELDTPTLPPGDSNIVLWNPQDDPHIVPNFQLTFESEGTLAAAPLLIAHYLNARGSVTLASSNPDDQPIVDFNYFGNQTDKENFALAFVKAQQIARGVGLTQEVDPCISNPACSTPLGIFQAHLDIGFFGPGYHFTATAAICKVVHSIDLSVKGTQNLYIVDASILPRTPGGNTMATTYAVAERSVDVVETSMKLPIQLGVLFPACI